MSILSDIHKRSNGFSERKEDISEKKVQKEEEFWKWASQNGLKGVKRN
jgi:hypothetical protein